jgi:hypothetical protein
MEANQTLADACVHDEVVQTSAALFYAASLRTTYARRQMYDGLQVSEYAMPSQIFGRISLFSACGDHLQFPPVPESSSLIAPLLGTSDEHKVGASMFKNLDYIFEMHTTKRFTDSVLINILAKMRGPKEQAKLIWEEWQA